MKYYILALSFLTLISCTQDIELDLPPYESKLVIEGQIEPGTGPQLLISTSTSYYDPVEAHILDTDIQVIVSHRDVHDTLVGVFLPDSLQIEGALFFSFKNKFVGEVGERYDLTVHYNGETSTATTVIPEPVKLDSIWFLEDEKRDSIGFLSAHLSDPDTLGNQYRWMVRQLHPYQDIRFIAPLGSVFDDRFFNGQSFDFFYDRPLDWIFDNTDAVNDDEFYNYYNVGDTVIVKFLSLNRESFDFWKAVELQYSNNGNPFGVPTPVQGNITNGEGIWAGYGVYQDTIVATLPEE